MKILTRHEQKEIQKDRNTIYDYILSNPIAPDKLDDFGKAIRALADISCTCGLWDKPFEDGGSDECL
ncbi:MAG: hypothetical protein LUD12_13290 [Lachnospiraceae bacterium]|nr:hypothetical protein [Lachnospiraceae bacterium]